MRLRSGQLLPLIAALFTLYIIWGSTYLALSIGVKSWPPFMLAGLRFMTGGTLLITILLLRGHPLPSLRLTLNAALIGILLLATVARCQ